ncbi:MAG TPA: hypothetical protein VNN73_06195 [Blastocatellia bacterium]|nr:hypothetical protein [Blastocatellia bacterium]
MGPEREEKLEQLEKLLGSRALQGSESLKAFLKYVVLKALDNQESQLKEYTIATEVFGRSSSHYDPRSDSVVRVQAGRLRVKLQEYYATEGKDDKVLIDLPKGKYAPTFSYQQGGNGGSVADAISAKQYAEAVSVIWESFLNSPERIIVAFSNTLFEGTAETGMRLLKPLDSHGVSVESPVAAQRAREASPIITEHYTGIGEVMGVYYLGDLFYRAGHLIRVKRSLLLTWDDLKASNIVILGSPAENFLLRDLPQEQELVFRVVEDENRNPTFAIVNTKPRDAEREVYFAKQEGPSRSQISEDYALVSLLRGLNEKRRLLMLAGITTFGTQAAAEYVTQFEHIKDLIAHLNQSAEGEPIALPSYYQILIKVKVNGGVPVQISYVTHHVL